MNRKPYKQDRYKTHVRRTYPLIIKETAVKISGVFTDNNSILINYKANRLAFLTKNVSKFNKYMKKYS